MPKHSVISNNSEQIRQTYDTVARYYDHPANFFSQVMAHAMLQYLQPEDNCHLLDAGTGTGVVALHAAQQLPQGHITGIDLSPAMITQARHKAVDARLKNTVFQVMDMENLTFADNKFDAISCCFSLYFLQDMTQGLRHLIRTLRPEGKIVVGFYQKEAFMPLAGLFRQDYAAFRPKVLEQPEAWLQLTDADTIYSLFDQVGIYQCHIYEQPLGFYLKTPDDWWDLLWSTGYRSSLNALSKEELGAFRQQHLQKVAKLCTTAPYWIDTPAMIAIGTKSAV